MGVRGDECGHKVDDCIKSAVLEFHGSPVYHCPWLMHLLFRKDDDTNSNSVYNRLIGGDKSAMLRNNPSAGTNEFNSAFHPVDRVGLDNKPLADVQLEPR